MSSAEEIACCGQPPFNSGYHPEARTIATPVLEKLADAEAVVIGSGSCGAMVKNFYPELFKETRHAELAKEVAARTWEFSDFLVCRLGVTDLGAKFPHKVTFHDGCHGLRELGIHKQPRALLANVRDLELVEMTELSCWAFRDVRREVSDDLHRNGRGEMRQRRRDWRGIHRLQRFELPDAHPRPAVAPGQADQNHQSRRGLEHAMKLSTNNCLIVTSLSRCMVKLVSDSTIQRFNKTLLAA